MTRRLNIAKSLLAATILLSASSALAQDIEQADIDAILSPMSEIDFKAFEKEERAKQKIISKCMKSKGFKYFPRSLNLKAAKRISKGKSPKPKSDKNAEYIETLSKSEFEAYFDALYGFTPDNPSGNELETGNSCVSQAEREIVDSFEVKRKFKKQAKLAILDAEDDPQVKQARGLWKQCLSEEGISIETEADLYRKMDEMAMERVSKAREAGTDASEVEPVSSDLRDMKGKASKCRSEANLDNFIAVARSEKVKQKLSKSEKKALKELRKRQKEQNLD